MTEERIQMTQRGHDKLTETLEHLKTTRREEISEYMGKAIEDGDLRESAAYDEARMQQSENEAKIRDIEAQLEKAVIINEAEMDMSAVGLGAQVKIKDAKGNERTFEMVGAYEVDVLKGKISDASPIGQALMGKKVGEVVPVPLPKGNAEFTVLEVTYEK